MIEYITGIKKPLLRSRNACSALVTVALLVSPVFRTVAAAQLPKIADVFKEATQKNGAAAKAVSPEQQREIAVRLLAEAQKERDSALAPASGISGQNALERHSLIDGLVTRIRSQLSLIDERDELRRTRRAVEQKVRSWAGFTESPPYSVLLVDELIVSVLTARAKVEGLTTNQALLGQQGSHYREAAELARGGERQAVDDLDRAQLPEERLSASWQKELAGLRARNADAMAGSVALRSEVLGERLAIAAVELELLERKLAEARKQMVFSRADLDKVLSGLKADRLSLEQELEASLARDVRSRSTLARTRQELQSLKVHSGRKSTSLAIQLRHDGIEARNRAAMAWVESSRFETEVITALIAINKSTARFWEKRYSAITDKNSAKLRGILAEFRKGREQLKPWLEYSQQQLVLYQAAERAQESLLDRISERSSLRLAEEDLLAAHRFQRQLAERQKNAVAQVDLERQGWLEEIERAQQTRGTIIRLKNWFGTGSEILQRVWRFEIFAVEDTVEVAGQKIVTSRGVTVGKSVGALLLFIVGYVLAGYLGRRFHRIMITRFGVGEHQANVIRRWLLALTIFFLTIITLNLARIPLTVFAFLGGALAIGVGFGTQTIIKNFISGILILLERNIKVGDTIDVDGVVGRIVTVDTRASTVLGFDGVETVIPNSMFLESKVTNWTHSNARLRRMMRVGVAYGSPLARVRDILTECGNAHGSILKEPPVEVFFEEFGDSSLVFALYFWIEYGPGVNPQQIASDLRFMIDQRFAEEKIVLAFPQRDVHLDSGGPLRIEVVSSGNSE